MAGETYVTNVAISGDAVTGAWTSWTPVLTAVTTNPTLGTGSGQTGRYSLINKTVAAEFSITFGSAGVAAGTGAYSVSLPVTAKGTAGNSEGLGHGWCWDVSATKMTLCFFRLSTATKAVIYLSATSTYQASDAAPHAWANGDVIQGVLNYEAA